MLTVDEAREAILEAISPLGPERVTLGGALGRVLAQDVRASEAHPSFDNSAMDGYALRWDEVSAVAAGDPVALPVSMDVPAGAVPERLPVGTAARIMTGGRLPEGADTVVMREDTDEAEAERVIIKALPGKGKGAHIRRRGENIEADQVVLEPGAVLGPGEIGLLATFGRSVVAVRRRPRVAIISTGDELVEVDEQPGAGQIVNSSSWALSALVAQAGGIPVPLPIARDTFEDTLARFEAALSAADIVISIGGVSVGDYDVVKAVLGHLCEGLDFWKVRMKPGKPLAFGRSRGGQIPLIGLPGNPVSAYVSFWQFVRPAMRKAMGFSSDLRLPRVRATLSAPIRSTPTRLDFQRGHLALLEDGWRFDPYKGQGSGNPMSLVKVTGLAAVPIGCAGLSEGDQVVVEVLPPS